MQSKPGSCLQANRFCYADGQAPFLKKAHTR